MGRCILSRVRCKCLSLEFWIHLLIGEQQADGNGHGTHVAYVSIFSVAIHSLTRR